MFTKTPVKQTIPVDNTFITSSIKKTSKRKGDETNTGNDIVSTKRRLMAQFDNTTTYDCDTNNKGDCSPQNSSDCSEQSNYNAIEEDIANENQLQTPVKQSTSGGLFANVVSPSISKGITEFFSPLYKIFNRNKRNNTQQKEDTSTKNIDDTSSMKEEVGDNTHNKENDINMILTDETSTNDDAISDGYVYIEDEEFEDGDWNPFVFIATLPPLKECVAPNRKMILPKQASTLSLQKKKTLVLDLDETLVHSSLSENFSVESDFQFDLVFDDKKYTVSVLQRPYLLEFMERVNDLFEVVIFTASQQVYAEKLLDIIDPESKLIKHRIYRDSCVCVEGNYLKDLSVLGRDLSQTVIVDNSPQAFAFQLENGIPIQSWYDCPEDDNLLRLLPFLEKLAQVDDVRPMVSQKFLLHERVETHREHNISGILFH